MSEFSQALLKATRTERNLIREEILDSFYSAITLVANEDGTYAAHICDITIEGNSPNQLLREIAAILEES